MSNNMLRNFPHLFIENKKYNHSFYLGESYDTENERPMVISEGSFEINIENLEKIISFINDIKTHFLKK